MNTFLNFDRCKHRSWREGNGRCSWSLVGTSQASSCGCLCQVTHWHTVYKARGSRRSRFLSWKFYATRHSIDIPVSVCIRLTTQPNATPARRKQGGSQSLNDHAKGAAKSAGAQLRRYGEQALQDVSANVNYRERISGTNRKLIQDIRNLIEEWTDDINESERIWLRASASNRRIFIGYDDAVITKGTLASHVHFLTSSLNQTFKATRGCGRSLSLRGGRLVL